MRETARRARSAAVAESALSHVGSPYVGPIISFSRTSLKGFTLEPLVRETSVITLLRTVSIYSSGSIPTNRSWARQDRTQEAIDNFISSPRGVGDAEEEDIETSFKVAA
jgi:hypothetical protein